MASQSKSKRRDRDGRSPATASTANSLSPALSRLETRANVIAALQRYSSRLVDLSYAGIDDQTVALNESEDRAIEVGVYDNTRKAKASQSEKNRLARARLQRLHTLYLMVPRELTVSTYTPKNSLSGGARCSVVIGTAIWEIPRPRSFSQNRRIYCECRGCANEAEQQLKADRYWLAGDFEKALTYGAPSRDSCEYRLPKDSDSIPLRPPRRLVPKGVDFISEREKQLAVTEEVAGANGATDADLQIARIEEDIRRMIGSADWKAEVIVISTSLHVSLRAYKASYKLQRFFECKGVDYVAVDANADIGTDSPDFKTVRAWNNDKVLLRDATKVTANVPCPILVPSVLIDGIPVGSIEDILALEDDNDLDYVLAREACPNCLRDRSSSSSQCHFCGAKFQELLSKKFINEEDAAHLIRANRLNAGRIKAPTPKDFEKRRRQLGIKRLDEDIRTWFEEQNIVEFGVPSIGFTVEFDD